MTTDPKDVPSLLQYLPRNPGVFDILPGVSAFKPLAKQLATFVESIHNPAKLFIIGLNDDIADFSACLKEFLGEEQEYSILCSPPRILEKDGYEAEFCFANEGNADAFIKRVRDDKSIILVTLYQTNHEEFLPKVLQALPWLSVYAVDISEDETPSSTPWFEKRRLGPDGLLLPEGVDLDAEESSSNTSIPNIPDNAMYGKAYDLAKSLSCPMGFAYPSVLATACGFGIDAAPGFSERPTLYVALIGDVAAGKSVAKDRSAALFFGPTPEEDGRWIYKVPASDRGLYQLIEKNLGRPCILAQDELRNMMGKGSIEGSTLMSVMCNLYNSNYAGVADKKGKSDINAKLSLLGCLKIANPSEFPKVFDYASAHGFYDRCVFGLEPDNSWRFKNHFVSKIDFRPSSPTVSPDVEEMFTDWQSRDKSRKRLGEIARRVAYISCAINGDSYVSEKAVIAAINFVEWQERIRYFFRAAEGSNLDEQCTNAITEAFRRAPGRASNFRQLSQKNNWHRHYAGRVTRTRKELENLGVLVYDKPSKKHILYEEK